MEQINNLSKLLNKNRKLSWTLFITYIAIFVGCATFPLFPQYTGYSNINFTLNKCNVYNAINVCRFAW